MIWIYFLLCLLEHTIDDNALLYTHYTCCKDEFFCMFRLCLDLSIRYLGFTHRVRPSATHVKRLLLIHVEEHFSCRCVYKRIDVCVCAPNFWVECQLCLMSRVRSECHRQCTISNGPSCVERKKRQMGTQLKFHWIWSLLSNLGARNYKVQSQLVYFIGIFLPRMYFSCTYFAEK